MTVEGAVQAFEQRHSGDKPEPRGSPSTFEALHCKRESTLRLGDGMTSWKIAGHSKCTGMMFSSNKGKAAVDRPWGGNDMLSILSK
jgi:hypothetical protein